MTKKLFTEAVKAIEKQIRYDIEVSKNLGKVFPNAHSANLLPENHYINNVLIKVLQEEMGDTELCEHGQTWIEWFCFETDFGNESWRLKAYDENKQLIKMSNAAELFDYLNNR